MENPEDELLKYSLTSFRYFFEKERYKNKFNTCVFRAFLMVEGKCYESDIPFYCLWEVCGEHAPLVDEYIHDLNWQIHNFSDDEKVLVEALAAEEFDFEWLLRLYFDNLTKEDFFYNCDEGEEEENDDMVDGEGEVVLAEKKEEKKGGDQPAMRSWDIRGYRDVLLDDFFKTATKLIYKTFKAANYLEKEDHEKLINLVYAYATYIANDLSTVVWLAEGFMDEPEKYESNLKHFEPEAIRDRIINNMQVGKDNPPFSLEILDYHAQWDFCGENKVDVWVRLTTELGNCYQQLYFSHLKDEAFLYFPELYERILYFEGNIQAISPKEPEVLAALLAEGWDLQPVAHSYAKTHVEIPMWVNLENISKKHRVERLNYYEEALQERANPKPLNTYLRMRQWCAVLFDELMKIWGPMMEAECKPAFEADDIRLQKWAAHSTYAHASNLCYDLTEHFDKVLLGTEEMTGIIKGITS